MPDAAGDGDRGAGEPHDGDGRRAGRLRAVAALAVTSDLPPSDASERRPLLEAGLKMCLTRPKFSRPTGPPFHTQVARPNPLAMTIRRKAPAR